MDNFRFFTPTEVVFGKGVENQTGALAAKHGTRALIVYGKGSVVKSGLLARVMQSLKDAGIECEGFGGAQPNPTLSHAEEGVQKALDFCADIIIGVGGGSAIDTAKGIAHGAANAEHKLWDIWTKKVPLTKSLPVGAVLTMPAAGSEMSDSAVLTNTVLGKKAGIGTEFNRCRFAVINPEWGATLPAYQLAAGITDIMMHTMERYFIPGIKCDLTDEIAEGLLRTVIKNGAVVVQDPSDYDAMAEVFWASSLSHNNTARPLPAFGARGLPHCTATRCRALRSSADVFGIFAMRTTKPPRRKALKKPSRFSAPSACLFVLRIWMLTSPQMFCRSLRLTRRQTTHFACQGYVRFPQKMWKRYTVWRCKKSKEIGMMLQRRIFYIADMHFGHKNILKYDKRPFADTGQMDEEIIRRWNERVGGDDTVYVLGDAFFKGEEKRSQAPDPRQSRPQQRQASKAVGIRQRV